jgi:hypothetical protein
MVLHIPNTQGRYYIQEILDAWTNVPYEPGARNDTPAGDYLITGPSWHGTPPPGITQVLTMPTNMAWILGRTYTTGEPNDVQMATTIQHQFTLTPLNDYGTPYTPPPNLFANPAIDMQTPPLNQVSNMSAGTFFGMLATMWMSNPPQSVDGPILANLAKVGLVPGNPYDLNQEPLPIQLGLESAARAALKYISSNLALEQVSTPPLNGWKLTTGFDGQWQTNYLERAVTAYRGLGINAEQGAVYGYSQRDNTGLPLNAANRYTITFPANTPPVSLEGPSGQTGFWSVTLYNSDGTLTGSPFNNLGSTQIIAGTWKPNADGSYTIVVQQNQPADTSNWLQAPAGNQKFTLVLRMYSPMPQVYDPSNPQYPYKPPVIQLVSNTENASPASLYVEQLYHDLLGRDAEPAGLQFWTSLLDAGASRATVAAGIWNSPEHRGIEVDGFYQTYLHRAADPAGQLFWINALQAGMSETAVAQAFLTSPEYTGAYPDSVSVVVGYYADVLGRLPDQAGFSFWQQAAAQGASGAQLSAGFLTSEEASRNLLEGYYQQYLGRQPDPSGEATWLALLGTAGNSPASVGQAILASDEYFARAQGS